MNGMNRTLLTTMSLVALAACTKNDSPSSNNPNFRPAAALDPICAKEGYASNSGIADTASGLTGFWEIPNSNSALASETGRNSLFFFVILSDGSAALLSSDMSGKENKRYNCLPALELGTAKMTGKNEARIYMNQEAIAKARADGATAEEIAKASTGELIKLTFTSADDLQMINAGSDPIAFRRAKASVAKNQIEVFIKMTERRTAAMSVFVEKWQGHKLVLSKKSTVSTDQNGTELSRYEETPDTVAASYTTKDNKDNDVEIQNPKKLEFISEDQVMVNDKQKNTMSAVLFEDGRLGILIDARLDEKTSINVVRGAIVDSPSGLRLEDTSKYKDSVAKMITVKTVSEFTKLN